jgi:hypothetical protein
MLKDLSNFNIVIITSDCGRTMRLGAGRAGRISPYIVLTVKTQKVEGFYF